MIVEIKIVFAVLFKKQRIAGPDKIRFVPIGTDFCPAFIIFGNESFFAIKEVGSDASHVLPQSAPKRDRSRIRR